MKKGVCLSFVGLFFLFFNIFGFQEKKQEILPEKHEVAVRLVLVDVIVVKDNKFVKDLKKEDFELFEDNRKVPINSFELISFEQRTMEVIKEEEEQKKLSARPKKRLVAAFDSINSWQKDIKDQNVDIVGELTSLIQLGHEVMISQLSPQKGFEVLQPFTTDDELIKSSVETASANMWSLGTDLGTVPPQNTFWTGTDSYLYETMMRMDYLYKELNKFEKTISGMLAALNMIKDLPGRKYLLLISGGIPDISPADTLPDFGDKFDLNSSYRFFGINRASSGRNFILPVSENIKIFDPFNILGDKAFKSSEEVIREVIRFANAQNISIYSLSSDTFVKHLNPGVSAEHYQKYEEANLEKIGRDRINRAQNLQWISEDTGAESLRGAAKFDNFREVMRTDLNHYYQLSFYPQREGPDDKYHELKVKVKQSGVEVRFRKGYTDYSREEENKIQLVTAFYMPSLFKELPLEAKFTPFVGRSKKHEPWMSVALPVEELFLNRFVEDGLLTLILHVWIYDEKTGEKGFGGQVNLPLNINTAFKDYIKTIDYLRFHFKGPEISFRQREYKAIFALVDPSTNEIGTWESSFSLPDFDEKKKRAIVNCVLGDISGAFQKGESSFVLSQQDGSLEFGDAKFFPRVTNRFMRWGGVHILIQTYLPQGEQGATPQFFLVGEDRQVHPLSGELLVKSWIKKIKIWSGIFFIDIHRGSLGENSLYIELPGTKEGDVLSKKVDLTIHR